MKNQTLKKIIMMSLLLFGSAQSFAAGYGAAGCGLGSQVFENKNEWYEQVMAATTNAIASQTISITFGLINCDANKLASHSERANIFVSANKNSVINQLSTGSGESVSVLSSIYGCESNEFGSIIKSNYKDIISNDAVSSESIVENINKVLKENNACSLKLS